MALEFGIKAHMASVIGSLTGNGLGLSLSELKSEKKSLGAGWGRGLSCLFSSPLS